MKKTIVIVLECVFGLILVANSVCFAESVYSNQEESLNELINRLNNNYDLINKSLKKLETNLNNYPHTTLTMSVVKGDKNINIVSIEVLDLDYPLHSHIYTPLENKALESGSRHQLFRGEIKEGGHTLKIIYYWAEGGAPPAKGEILINLFLISSKNYFIQLSFENKEGKIELEYSLLSVKNR